MANATSVVLVANDGTRFTVPRDVVEHGSLLLRDLLDGEAPTADAAAAPTEVPVAAAKGPTLALAVQYMQLRFGNPPREIERPLVRDFVDVVDETDKAFVKPLTEAQVMELIVTANFLNMSDLRDLCAARLAQAVKEKSVEEIRAMFGVEGDFTPEELEALRKEHGLERV